MEEQKEPRYAPGHEMTLHPGDPVRGGDLLAEVTQERERGGDRVGEGGKAAGAEGAERAGGPGAPEAPGPGRMRRTESGGDAFGATREPEYRAEGPDGRKDGAAGPDGRSAAPGGGPEGGTPFLGAVTQDDPRPRGFNTDPDRSRDGDLTFVAVFEDITGAHSCADDLQRRIPGVEVALVARRGDGPEQGTRPGNVVTGEGYGLSAEDQSPPQDPGLGSGVAVGATVGATAGLLAATYFIPQFGATLVGTGSLVSTLAGAGLGSFLGGLLEVGASEQRDGDDATLYAGQARRGGVLLLARCDREEAEQVRRLLEVWQPLEVRVQ